MKWKISVSKPIKITLNDHSLQIHVKDLVEMEYNILSLAYMATNNCVSLHANTSSLHHKLVNVTKKKPRWYNKNVKTDAFKFDSQ